MNISKKTQVKKDIPFSQSSSSPRSLSFPRKRESIKRGLISDQATKELKQATMKQLFTYGTKGEKTKQTEIGEIPLKWEIVEIEDLFHLKQGKSLSAKNQTGLYLKSFLRTSNIFWGHLDLTKLDAMDILDKERETLLLKKDDLLVCEGGDIGRTAIWNDELSECYYQNHIHRLRVKSNQKVCPLFYMYWMDVAVRQLNVYGTFGNRTTIPNLPGKRLLKFKLPLPPLEEQKKIAGVLSQIQKAMETQNQQIKATKELKQATMKQLFTYGTRGEKTQTKKDIPFLQSSSSSHSLSLPRKQESIKRGSISDNLLRMINLGDICTFEYGKPLKKADRYKGKYPVLGSNGIVDYHNQYLVKGPCIIVGRKGTAGKITYSENNCFPIDTTFFVQLRNKNQCDLKYLDFAMQVSNLEKLKTQSNVPGLNRNDAYKIKIPLPSLEEQKEIADILQGIDKKVEVHEKKKKALEELFKTMLNKLMTGKIRVHNLNILKQYKGYYV